MACLIAAPSSGSGKTLLSLSLAALARRRGLRIQPFKVGPDYLDPQLLTRVSGQPCRNLDTLLCGPEWVRRSFHWHGSRADLCLVEGVMGLFDGRGPTSAGSSAEVADLLDLPVVLVVEASRQAGSIAALVRGFRDHGPPPVRLAGVVLNRVASDRHRALLREALDAIAVPLLGILPVSPALELPSRHLGLLPPQEVNDLDAREAAWAALAEHHLDLERLWPLLSPPAALPQQQDPIRWCLTPVATDSAGDALKGAPLPLAIASDAAFHFRYPEATELLGALGLEARAWSPLADEPLPAGCRAVVLPGGYPELHAPALAAAHRSLGALRQAAAAGVPLVAECGGLLLLGRSLEDQQGRRHGMAGLLPFSARRGSLSLGYREAVGERDGLLVRRGERLVGHEFHRWQLTDDPEMSRDVASCDRLWQLEGWGNPRRAEGWTSGTMHASWLHLHWAGCPKIPRRLAAAAVRAAPLTLRPVS
ncbi:cobyrinate a,c-diamide synthase [Synechococcus sp. CBW1002]|uniref:cobyrinate a,c-diamide synthase n=1 Tax=unclassified Synechococcus TaxID=2626047 RepID=UPI0018CD602D|nr:MULTISPECIES: cobyrinate a,c-diamide synthase [unclassified Synechococcus]QPN58749.1 cobyrinate a,c-diamide synthase [Synechococcus sp. CBW1002]CAK6699068.1 Cobyrinate a,c-diamide synthase [Synechococcus sp. CBW1107]